MECVSKNYEDHAIERENDMVPDVPDDTIRNEIDVALNLISAGIYGECVVSSRKHLEALPYATKYTTCTTR
ncbi:MAG: hypothetical protein IH947_13960 [Bacteroidetes bacterium]|nr:hypothetical protein [Bacteroidota bacterium]